MTSLPDVIAQIESAGRSHAQRFEDAMFHAWMANPTGPRQAVVTRVQAYHGGPAGCSLVTATQIACTSYGLYQILGESLWGDLGMGLDNVNYMDNLALQRSAFDLFCARRKIAFGIEEMSGDAGLPKRQLFALRYNGPANPDAYAAKIAETIARLSAAPSPPIIPVGGDA